MVKYDLILNMTPENGSKTFKNWLKATTSIPKETIESKVQREKL